MISFGIFEIYWYGFFLTLGMLVAFFITLKIAKNKNINENNLLDLFFYLIIGGIFGARVYDIFLELPFYINNPWQTFKIWEGGLAIHGAIISGLIIVFYFCKIKKLDFWKITAVITPGLAIGQAIGRFGNYFNQELFGKPSNLAWKIFIEYKNRPINYQDFDFFHPTFLYESLGLLVIFIFLIYLLKHFQSNKKNYILIVSSYVLLYSLLRFFLEFIRIDRAPELFGLRWPQIISLIFISISIFLIFYAKKQKK